MVSQLFIQAAHKVVLVTWILSIVKVNDGQTNLDFYDGCGQCRA